MSVGIGWNIDELSHKQKEIVSCIKYHRRVFAIGGRRSGKSTACAYAAAKLTWRWSPGSDGLMFAPTEAQLKDLNLDKWQRVAPPHLYELKSDGDKDNGPHILCYHPQDKGPPKTSKVFLRTEKAAKRGEGLTIAWAYGEEIQDCPLLWDIAQDRVSDKDAEHLTVFGAGIPENGWLEEEYGTFTDGYYREKGDAVWVRCQTADNGIYLPDSYLADQEENLTKEEHDEKSLGLFRKAHGTIHPEFDRSTHIKTWDFIPGRKVWIGKDFNINPQTAGMAQEHEGSLRFFDEHMLREASVGAHAQSLVEWCERREIDHTDPQQCQIIPDATGKKRGGETFDLSSAHKILRNYGFSLNVPPENPRRTNRDDAVNWALKAKNGKIRLYFDPRCENIIRSMAGIKHQERDIKTNELTHWDDLVGYVVHRLYPVRAESPPTSPISVSRQSAKRKFGKSYPL